MSTLVIIPAVSEEKLLEQRIAGLTLARRLFFHFKRAGVENFFVITEDSRPLSDNAIPVLESLRGLDCRETEKLIVLRPGVLPEIDCIKEILATPIDRDEIYLMHEGILAFCPSIDCFELEKGFKKFGFERLKEFLTSFLRVKTISCKKGNIYEIKGPNQIPDVEKALLKRLIKDTEGFMSRYFERRISLFITKRLINTYITPNQITIISVLIGLLGAAFMAIGQGLWQIIGAWLFLAHSIVDGCDGEIARLKFLESKIGGILDFWGDNVVHAAVFGAIGFEWWTRTGQELAIILSLIAIFGTFFSASIVFFTTMKKKSGEGPLYTSVSEKNRESKLVKVADYLSRRDFIYLVIILAYLKHLDWFLIATAIGTLCFSGALLWIKFKG